jgi:hypothetical protein
MGTMRRPPAVSTTAPGSVPAAATPARSRPDQRPSEPPTRPVRRPAKTRRPSAGTASGSAPVPSAAATALGSAATRRTARLRRISTGLGWAALLWLGLVYLSVPELRSGLRCVLALGYLLLLWFFLARTKTLSGPAIGALFAICLPWSLVIALATRALATRALALGPGPLAVQDPGARTALAAVAELSLLLVPLVLLPVLAPTRVRGFSVTDWLLAGLAAGASFQAVEEIARLDGEHAGYGPSPLSGGSSLLPHAGFAGRPVLTALVGVTIGLAVAAWRHGGKPELSPAARIAWRGLGVLAPPGCWWLAVSGQAGWNATLAVGDVWRTATDSSMPWLLRLGWQFGLHGFGLRWLLVALFLVAMLVDAGRLRNAAEEADDPLPYPFAPTSAADRWAGRLTRWAGTRTALPVTVAVWLIAAGAAVVAYAVRDLVVVLLGYSRAARPGAHRHLGRPAARPSEPQGRPQRRVLSRLRGFLSVARESRWTAISRGRAAGVMVRTIRAEAIALAAGPDTPATRRVTRAAGLTGLIGLLPAAGWLGPHWAGPIGDGVAAGTSTGPGAAELAPTAWLAGTAATFGSWAETLAIWQYVVLVLGFLALMVLAAGPLDPALGRGRSVWFTVRLPAGARALDRLGSYLSQSSPAELVMDAVGAGLGLLPGLAGPATGQHVRDAVQQFVADPSAFIAQRRSAARRATERPVPATAVGTVRARPPAGLPPVKLADGRLLSALSEDDERLFVATLDDLARDPSNDDLKDVGQSAEEQYRARIYGDGRRLISLRPEKWSDGQDSAYGMVCDTAFYDGRGVSWYLPNTVPEAIRHKANLEMDRRLIEFATIVYYPASPFRALEITTNHPLVAQALEERMSRLAIPGYVVVVP